MMSNVAFHVQLQHQNMSFTTYPIWLQWEKQLENDISDLKNDYSGIGPIIKYIF
jgi:hypothetical protein